MARGVAGRVRLSIRCCPISGSKRKFSLEGESHFASIEAEELDTIVSAFLYVTQGRQNN